MALCLGGDLNNNLAYELAYTTNVIWEIAFMRYHVPRMVSVSTPSHSIKKNKLIRQLTDLYEF